MKIPYRFGAICVLLAAGSLNCAFADIASVSNSTGLTTSDSGTLSFGSYATSWSGTTNNSSSGNLVLPGVTIPVGATIDSATLTLTISPPSVSGGISASRTESDFSYQVQIGLGFYCYSYNYYGNCTTGYSYPIYGYNYGHGGGASLFVDGSTSASSLSSGATSASLNTTGGTFDLLGLGFGPSLQNGDALSIALQQNLLMGYSISSYGYYAQTYYYGAYDYFANVTANLDVSYTSQVPEPAAWLLLLTMAGAIAGSSWRKLRRADSADPKIR